MDPKTDNRGVSGTSADDDSVVVPSDDEFSAAFDLAEIGEGDGKAAIADAGTSGDSVDLTSDNDLLDDGAAGTSGTVDTSAVNDDGKAEQRYKTLQGIHKKDKEQWDADRAAWDEEREQLRAQIAASTSGVGQNANAEAGTAGVAGMTKQSFLDSLTDEEKLELAEYEKDWNIVSQMEGKKRDAALMSLRSELADWKNTIIAKLTEQEATLTPVLQRAEQTDMVMHFNYLAEQHPDYEQYRDDGSIEAWIASKPRYLQDSLLSIYEGGSAEDVVDLLTDFKKENNILLTSDEAADKGGAIDPAKAEKKQALTSVATGQAAINTRHGEPEDFESAFDEAVQL